MGGVDVFTIYLDVLENQPVVRNTKGRPGRVFADFLRYIAETVPRPQ